MGAAPKRVQTNTINLRFGWAAKSVTQCRKHVWDDAPPQQLAPKSNKVMGSVPIREAALALSAPKQATFGWKLAVTRRNMIQILAFKYVAHEQHQKERNDATEGGYWTVKPQQ